MTTPEAQMTDTTDPTTSWRRRTFSILMAMSALAAVAAYGPLVTPAPAVAEQVSAGGVTTEVGDVSAAPGGTATLSVVVESDASRTVLVDVEIYDAAGRRVHQHWWPAVLLNAGESRRLDVPWAVPSELPTGTYTAKVGVFGTGWSPLLHWNDRAGTVQLTKAQDVLPVRTGSTVSVSPATATSGQRVALEIDVVSDQDRRALVDVEIYDPAGRKVFQKWWDQQDLSANVTRSFTTEWDVPSTASTGTYRVAVGIFGSGWSHLIVWDHRAADIVVGAGAPTTPTTTTTPTPTTTTPTTTPTTTTPTTTTTTTTTTTPPPSSDRFDTLPVGATLPSGDECAARVRPAVEIRPENTTQNATSGFANGYRTGEWSGFARVDGDFTGTTDEIIQWAACKWGIDEDIVRAQIIKESYWYMSANGDGGDSYGLGQVRVPYHGTRPSGSSNGTGAFEADNAVRSSAYNLDYTYASWRACYEGAYTWLNDVERNGTYRAGDVWGCLGVWFSGRWYVGTDAYLDQHGDSVRWHYENRTWESPTFING
jgi:hypothetical protein